SGRDSGSRRGRARTSPVPTWSAVTAPATAGTAAPGRPGLRPLPPSRRPVRSEEHTSELQSRENLVCRLPLEKKTSTNTQILQALTGHTTIKTHNHDSPQHLDERFKLKMLISRGRHCFTYIETRTSEI